MCFRFYRRYCGGCSFTFMYNDLASANFISTWVLPQNQTDDFVSVVLFECVLGFIQWCDFQWCIAVMSVLFHFSHAVCHAFLGVFTPIPFSPQHGWNFRHPPSATLCLFLLWNRSCHFFPLYGLGFLAPLSHPCQNGYVSLTKFNLAVDAFTHRWHRFEMATSPSLRQKGIAVRHRSTLSHRCFNFVFLSFNFCGSKRNKS